MFLFYKTSVINFETNICSFYHLNFGYKFNNSLNKTKCSHTQTDSYINLLQI